MFTVVSFYQAGEWGGCQLRPFFKEEKKLTAEIINDTIKVQDTTFPLIAHKR